MSGCKESLTLSQTGNKSTSTTKRNISVSWTGTFHILKRSVERRDHKYDVCFNTRADSVNSDQLISYGVGARLN